MAHKRASDHVFIEGAIRKVAEIGIENTRTKDVADYAGFSEATMYRRFPTKEILLREAFLYVDQQISNILTQSIYIRNPGDTPFGFAVYSIWHDTYRYLIDHKEETIFLIRYRYSSLYTEEVRSRRQAYNGGFVQTYSVLQKYFGSSDQPYDGFLINYIFEMTLCFSERVINGRVEDDTDTEQRIWSAISSAVNSWTKQQRGDAK